MNPRFAPWSRQDVDKFCDMVADGSTLAAAARSLGKTPDAGKHQMRRIAKNLGEQAA